MSLYTTASSRETMRATDGILLWILLTLTVRSGFTLGHFHLNHGQGTPRKLKKWKSLFRFWRSSFHQSDLTIRYNFLITDEVLLSPECVSPRHLPVLFFYKTRRLATVIYSFLRKSRARNEHMKWTLTCRKKWEHGNSVSKPSHRRNSHWIVVTNPECFITKKKGEDNCAWLVVHDSWRRWA